MNIDPQLAGHRAPADQFRQRFERNIANRSVEYEPPDVAECQVDRPHVQVGATADVGPARQSREISQLEVVHLSASDEMCDDLINDAGTIDGDIQPAANG